LSTLTLTAPAKLNLHLEVLGERGDGFHELAMLMQSIDLCDQLLVDAGPPGELQLECSDPTLPLDDSNLILKAAELLRQFVARPELGARIQLQKRIPIGAGLAGGSSDGASALLALSEFWGLSLTASELHGLAAALGSDVAFCLAGGSQLCFGRGERLEPLPPAPALGVLLLKDPSVSVSTPWAYGRCRELRSDFYLTAEADFESRRQSLRQGPLVQALLNANANAPGEPLGLPRLRNDLQDLVAAETASVQAGLALLKGASGAMALAMSGSGPSLFALFADQSAAALAQQQLQTNLQENGFESWVCSFLPPRTPHG
jgi:4-diphosphocytidyl-2-C-methyl-D-erythritol kinase